jgi:hypothetical protein
VFTQNLFGIVMREYVWTGTLLSISRKTGAKHGDVRRSHFQNDSSVFVVDLGAHTGFTHVPGSTPS